MAQKKSLINPLVRLRKEGGKVKLVSGVISVQTRMSCCGVRGQVRDSRNFGLLKTPPFGEEKCCCLNWLYWTTL